jgi:hypothetical protein
LDLPIDLINGQTSNLMMKLFQAGIDSKCHFQNICCIIGIECSQTLLQIEKLASIFLAVSMANSFSMLEIPYSIVIFADFNFQFIL